MIQSLNKHTTDSMYGIYRMTLKICGLERADKFITYSEFAALLGYVLQFLVVVVFFFVPLLAVGTTRLLSANQPPFT